MSKNKFSEFESGEIEKLFEVDHKKIIEECFEEHPILFHTSLERLDSKTPLQNHRFVNKDFSLYGFYRDKIKEIYEDDENWEERIKPYSEIRNIIEELEKEKKIIHLKDVAEIVILKGKKQTTRVRNINNIFKAEDPKWASENIFDLDYEKTEFKRGIDARDGKEKTISVRPPLYILLRKNVEKESVTINPYELLIKTIKEMMRGETIEAIEEEITEKRVKEAIEREKNIRLEEMERKWKDDLETFENQRLKTDDFSIIDSFLNDITNYLEEMFLRVCPRCGKDIFLPSERYDGNGDLLSNGLSEDVLKEYSEDLKNAESSIEDFVLLLDKIEDMENEDMARYIRLKYLQALYLLDLEEAKEKPNHPLEEESMEEWSESLVQLKNRGLEADDDINGFRCPNCDGLIIKERLLNVREIIFEVLNALEGNQPVILYGYPDYRKHLSIRV